jgi:hypothetical protein
VFSRGSIRLFIINLFLGELSTYFIHEDEEEDDDDDDDASRSLLNYTL